MDSLGASLSETLQLGGRTIQARVAQVKGLRPDLVIVAGDLFEGHGWGEHEQRMVQILSGLSVPMGVYGVTGNHEFYAGMEASARFFQSAGIHLLRDGWKEARPGLILAGINDVGHSLKSGDDSARIEQALTGRPESAATILISHRPEGAEAAAEAGVGLMLSGHTHGGQIWPFNYVVKRFFPLLEGQYEVGGMPVIVTRGTGTWGPRMRLWRPSEIVLITLHPSMV